MNTILQWLLLALAVAIGWGLGRWGRENASQQDTMDDEASVRERLQFLFTNYSDETIENFVQSLDVSTDTINLHLSIGAHFRNKGEVERAILIHQNLLARPELPARYSAEVTFALAQDYRAAGLLDRAEALLQQLMGSPHFGIRAARELIALYQQEKEWDKARRVAMTLVEGDSDPTLRKTLAYILCELADHALRHDDRFTARQHLREALQHDASCVRATLQLAELQHRDHRDREARVTLLRVFEQNPAFGPEAVDRLVRYAREQGDETRLLRKLRKLYDQTPSTSLLLAIVDCVEKAQGRDAAIAVLRSELENKPSLRGLLKLVRLSGRDAGFANDDARLVSRVGELLLSNRPVYCCVQCGFSGQQLHWRCPSCKTWEAVQPVQGVEGE
ncbi:lipopolysaccharide assembly protein LapB [Marinobacteraceae bacterium S3BR75-40.1]